MGIKLGNWLGKEKIVCVFEVKNEKFIIMYIEMWEDFLDFVKES